MHRNRNKDTWPELKAKRHNKFDDAPLENVDEMHSPLNDEIPDSQKIKKTEQPSIFLKCKVCSKVWLIMTINKIKILMKENHENYEQTKDTFLEKNQMWSLSSQI